MSMNIQRKNSAHHFRKQSEREQTLGMCVRYQNNEWSEVHYCGEGYSRIFSSYNLLKTTSLVEDSLFEAIIGV